ncbi:MAG: O-antigen ligase family protein, partial [bacterium]|nr:O-antigen ligase family protein [bacterium]
AGIIFVIVGSLIFTNKDSAFVQDNVGLRRITSISLSERTAQTRLMAWGSAWQGFLAKPILGYGQENFYIVFNQYFNPDIYSHAGSQVWFDRAHNIFIDHLIAGGIIGFILYTLFILWPLWTVFKQGVWAKGKEGNSFGSIEDQIIFLAIFSFVIQGLLVFEAMVTYLPLLIIIAFIAFQYAPVKYNLANKKALLSFLIVWFIAIFPIMYIVNIKEAKASLDLVSAMRLGQSDPSASMENYFEVIGRNTSGTNEYRLRAAEALQGFIINKKFTPYESSEYIDRLEKELNARIEGNPKDVPAYLLLMRHYNYVYILDPTKLYKVEELGQKALEYSPTRPQIYYELGYADLYLYQWLADNGDSVKAQEYKDKMVANFQKAIDLNNNVTESYLNMIMALLVSDEIDKIQEYFDIMDRMNINYKTESSLLRLVNSAVHGEHYDWSLKFYTWLVVINPDNPDYYIGKALSYANLGQNDLAIEEAEKIKNFSELYIEQVNTFVARVKSGYYENKK